MASTIEEIRARLRRVGPDAPVSTDEPVATELPKLNTLDKIRAARLRATGGADVDVPLMDDIVAVKNKEPREGIAVGSQLKEGTKDIGRQIVTGTSAMTEVHALRQMSDDFLKQEREIPFSTFGPGVQARDEFLRTLPKDPAEKKAILEDPEKFANARVAFIMENSKDSAEKAQKVRAWIQDKLKSDPEYLQTTGFIEDFIRMGPQIGTQVLAGLLTGGAGSAAMMYAQITGATVEQLTEEGVPLERAVEWGMVNAAVQAPMEAFALGKLTGVLKLKGAVAKKLKKTGDALGTEWITEFMQSYPEAAAGIFAKNPDAAQLEKWDKFLDEVLTMEHTGGAAREATIASLWGGIAATPGLMSSDTMNPATAASEGRSESSEATTEEEGVHLIKQAEELETDLDAAAKFEQDQKKVTNASPSDGQNSVENLLGIEPGGDIGGDAVADIPDDGDGITLSSTLQTTPRQAANQHQNNDGIGSMLEDMAISQGLKTQRAKILHNQAVLDDLDTKFTEALILEDHQTAIQYAEESKKVAAETAQTVDQFLQNRQAKLGKNDSVLNPDEIKELSRYAEALIEKADSDVAGQQKALAGEQAIEQMNESIAMDEDIDVLKSNLLTAEEAQETKPEFKKIYRDIADTQDIKDMVKPEYYMEKTLKNEKLIKMKGDLQRKIRAEKSDTKVPEDTKTTDEAALRWVDQQIAEKVEYDANQDLETVGEERQKIQDAKEKAAETAAKVGPAKRSIRREEKRQAATKKVSERQATAKKVSALDKRRAAVQKQQEGIRKAPVTPVAETGKADIAAARERLTPRKKQQTQVAKAATKVAALPEGEKIDLQKTAKKFSIKAEDIKKAKGATVQEQVSDARHSKSKKAGLEVGKFEDMTLSEQMGTLEVADEMQNQMKSGKYSWLFNKTKELGVETVMITDKGQYGKNETIKRAFPDLKSKDNAVRRFEGALKINPTTGQMVKAGGVKGVYLKANPATGNFGGKAFINVPTIAGRQKTIDAAMETAVHEHIHGLIDHGVRKLSKQDQAAFKNELEQAWQSIPQDFIKETLEAKDTHTRVGAGIIQVQRDGVGELITYAMAHPEFAAWLNTIPASPRFKSKSSSIKTVWDALVDLVVKTVMKVPTKLSEIQDILNRHIKIGNQEATFVKAPSVAATVAKKTPRPTPTAPIKPVIKQSVAQVRNNVKARGQKIDKFEVSPEGQITTSFKNRDAGILNMTGAIAAGGRRVLVPAKSKQWYEDTFGFEVVNEEGTNVDMVLSDAAEAAFIDDKGKAIAARIRNNLGGFRDTFAPVEQFSRDAELELEHIKVMSQNDINDRDAELMRTGNDGQSVLGKIHEWRDQSGRNIDRMADSMEQEFLEKFGGRKVLIGSKVGSGRLLHTAETEKLNRAMNLYVDSGTGSNKAKVDAYAKKLTAQGIDKITLRQRQHLAIIERMDSMSEAEIAWAESNLRTQYENFFDFVKKNKIIDSHVDNYVRRQWKFPRELKDAAIVWNGSGTSGFKLIPSSGKQRSFDSIVDGWEAGMDLRGEGGIQNVQEYATEVGYVYANRRFTEYMRGLISFTSGGLMHEVNSKTDPNFKPPAGYEQVTTHGFAKPFHKLYARKDIATELNKLGATASNLWSTGVLGAIRRVNSMLKSTILSVSLFHHFAGMRSYVFGVSGKKGQYNPIAAYKRGLKKLEDRTGLTDPKYAHLGPVADLLVREGLTVGRTQDWDQMAIQDSFIEDILLTQKGGAADVALKTWQQARRLKRSLTSGLFGRLFAGLKVESGALELVHRLEKAEKAQGSALTDAQIKTIAGQTATLINADFGGLHLQRMGRNPNWQKVAQMFLLAPDWTESNWRTVTGMIPGINNFVGKGLGDNPETEGMGKVYRHFWTGIALRGSIGVIGLQAMMLAVATDDEREEYVDFMVDNLTSLDKIGKGRWASVDITPVENRVREVFGMKKGEKRKVFNVLGHFKDIIKLADFRSLVKHKVSPMASNFEALWSGTDWKGSRFSTVNELVAAGWPPKFTADNKFAEDASGMTVWSTLPSILGYRLRQSLPIFAGKALEMAQAESGMFQGLAQAGGLDIKDVRHIPKAQRKYEEVRKEINALDNGLKTAKESKDRTLIKAAKQDIKSYPKFSVTKSRMRFARTQLSAVNKSIKGLELKKEQGKTFSKFDQRRLDVLLQRREKIYNNFNKVVSR